ncbi:hypothetical protein ETB97_011461 [Aspergillus alliaceus]|uniref:pyridoxal 5'-phosphate synthase n=1 Tax=Petromyces alliaceus TaxID=209559 RepID=A0A5N6GAI0_PETAA|nr:uncharacterized protein BDW43DRAFT_263423 [Aspergillus alliaceus]KAB8238284.1 hypothetical protein BDW43DRAFT_263423 [Aspergillus alliaceus]KAF5866576.1 hypothetical protein ETB97_011461 [Aspergillus burnettii]
MAAMDNTIRTQLRNLAVLAGPFAEVDFDDLPDTPHDAFKKWLNDAIAADVREPHAMTISTVDEQGCPDARVLILKNVDDRGWHFAVKRDSPKAQQLEKNGHAALTFYWPQVGRQIRLRGRATQLPEDECREDFAARPLKSRVSAMASKQSQVLKDRQELTDRIAETEAAVSNGQEQAFHKWRVYAVAPIAVEFWQGSDDRLHHRLRYALETENGRWRKDLLWP